MRRVAILGSTGSIGQNALKVIASLPVKFRVVGLSAHSNVACLLEQTRRFQPKYICLADESSARRARARLPSSYNVLSGQGGLEDLIQECNADINVWFGVNKIGLREA